MTAAVMPFCTVAVIGGGFSGGAIAFHLAGMAAEGRLRVVVFEPRTALGAGLAYDTAEPVHRINVAAQRMSLVPGDEGHFMRWLAENEDAVDAEARLADGRVFPRRSVFGRYVGAHLAPLVDAGRIEHVQDRVRSVRRVGERWLVGAAQGRTIVADAVVIATSHPPPAVPAALRALHGDPRLVANPLAPHALAAIGAQDRVLIVGTGLTMADIVAALDRRGHTGPITAISRRGQCSRGHGTWPMQSFGDFSVDPPATALGLLRRVRTAVAAAERGGLTWHAVFDTVRRQGGTIWAALPDRERRRLVRHLRPFWDTHRFRISPQVQAVLERRRAAGSLRTFAASLVRASGTGDGIEAWLRERAGREATPSLFDAVVVTTGPSHATVMAGEPYLAGLLADGCLRGDPIGLGIDCDSRARAIDAAGQAVPSLFVGGPLARARFGELMGLPEVSAFAQEVARQVMREVTEGRDEADAALRSVASVFPPSERADAAGALGDPSAARPRHAAHASGPIVI